MPTDNGRWIYEKGAVMRQNIQLQPGTSQLADKRVLVVGYRQGIAKVLRRLNIPFVIWHDKPLKNSVDCIAVHVSAFPASPKKINELAQDFLAPNGPFTHVIAGTESAVPVASVCRRALGARKSVDSVARSCHDKQRMKQLMRANDIPMTDFLTSADGLSPEQIFTQLGPKVVVKERKNSGGRGLTIAKSAGDIAARRERGLLYEKWVDGSEMSIESFVRDGEIAFTSSTSYVVKTHANLVPSGIDPSTLREAESINRRVIEALGIQWGLTHTEFFCTSSGVLFGEVALRPPGGYIMECISLAHQFDAWEAFVANELDIAYTFPSECRRAAGSVLLHPGRGRLNAIHHVETVLSWPSCVRFKTMIDPGSVVAERIGISEMAAYGLFVTATTGETRAELIRCIDTVRFELSDVPLTE